MKICPVKPISGFHHLASLSPPPPALLQPPLSSSFPSFAHACVQISVLPTTSISVFGPHLLFVLSLSVSVSLSRSWNRSISVTLCEHATPPPAHPPSPLIDLPSLLPLPPSLPPYSDKCAWIATLIHCFTYACKNASHRTAVSVPA